MTTIFTHIWQSTLFAAVAALVAFALRKNRAQVRYCVWLSASLKFAVPFSMFIALGSHIPWQPNARPAVSSAMLQIAKPLQAIPVFFSAPQQTTPAPGPVPTLLLAVWLIGCSAVLLRWARSWLRVRSAVLSAVPLSWETPIPAVETSALMEPGVFGIFRPVLVLPKGITRKLKTEHLQAILAHELCHVRRRDNLAAAAHMLMEALFWFHPMVWWIGARMVEERERACDEDVLRLGNQPAVYAESILKVCQFCVESPLVCVAGVTGADLKQRVVRIMTGEPAARLNFRTGLVLVVALTLVMGTPIAQGIAGGLLTQSEPAGQSKRQSFDVVSIKPTDPSNNGMSIRVEPGGRYVAKGMSVKMLIVNAYDLHEFQISGTPDWANSAKYDIAAESDDAEWKDLTASERDKILDLRLQSILAERFKFKFHYVKKEMPIYSLVVGKGGSKLQPASDDVKGPIMTMGGGYLTADKISMEMLAGNLSNIVDRVVQDKTGLTGSYRLKLDWTPDETQSRDASVEELSIFTAIQEQLGLKLERQKGDVDVLVVDHVERPSEN